MIDFWLQEDVITNILGSMAYSFIPEGVRVYDAKTGHELGRVAPGFTFIDKSKTT